MDSDMCEPITLIPVSAIEDTIKPGYIFCRICGDKAWISVDHNDHSIKDDCDMRAEFVPIQGVFVEPDIITKSQEMELVNNIDSYKCWSESQEGRIKQDFGPKINFKKQRVRVGEFCGFPKYAINLFNSLKKRYPSQLGDFLPVELCNLEYLPTRRSYIRPHYDDKWVWGDRLITINLLSPTVLRLTREFSEPPYEIIVPMPQRSLVIISGEARYDWMHGILPHDIKSRRLAMTWRELHETFLQEEHHEFNEFTKTVLEIAKKELDT